MPDEVPVYTRAQVEAEVARLYGNNSVKGIMALLDQYQSDGGGVERVQLAILKLSGKDLAKLRHNITQAKEDFRDVLYWAEYYRRS